MDSELPADPWALFESWLSEAVRGGLHLPEAMVLATAGPDHHPSARVVLYKGRVDDGLSFYTSYSSPKSRQLGRCPHAAVVFHWARLERQVRIEGRVSRLSSHRSDAYFAMRPRGSQLAAWASPQSQRLPSREALEIEVKRLRERFDGREVPRPEHWGGYKLVPERFEFWSGRPDRLNERWSYERQAGAWRHYLLAP